MLSFLLCKDCGDPYAPTNRGTRGLCRECHANPEVRARYGPVAPRGNKALSADRRLHSRRKRRLPRPTQAAPGSEAKILVLMARLAAREELHHPEDARLDLSRLPAEKVEEYRSFLMSSGHVTKQKWATKGRPPPATLRLPSLPARTAAG